MTQQTTPKEAPQELEQFKAIDEFNAIYDGNSKNELSEQLDQLGIAYHKTDSKNVLAWRLYDYQNPQQDDQQEQKAEQKPTAQDQTQEDQTQDDQQEQDIIKVENTSGFSLIETHTSTLLPAKQVTTIVISPKHDRDKVIRNIRQLNLTRGNKIKILEE